MDASMVMSKPAPQPTTPSNSNASDAHDDGEDFAAHLPPEDAPRAPDRPTTRRGEPREAAATAEDSTASDAETPQEASAEACMTLTAPIAPAVVRPQNSVVTIDISAFIAPTTTPADATAAAPTAGKPQAAAQTPANAAQTAAPPQAAQSEDAAAETPQQATQTPAAKATLPLETIALPVPTSTPVEARALPRLRAGRSEGGDTPTAEARPTANVATTPTANAQTAAASGVQTANAVQAATASTPTQEKAAAVDATPAGEALPAEHRARAVNEATATHAGHRATTPAALVAQHVIRRFEGRSTSIDVRLDPPELGRVQVSLEVGADNKVTAVVAAENPATLSDLVRSARELERALQDAGLELDAGGLSFDLAERGENASSDNAASGKSSGRGEGGGETLAQQPVSRPFGLESWRGARVDVMA